MITVSLAATPENVPRVRASVSDFARSVGLAVERLADVRLAITEACANVVVHAYDGPGTLDVSADQEERRLVVHVRDRGRGMAGRSPNAGLGMGMRLIAACADELHIETPSEGGTDLRIVFRLAAPVASEGTAPRHQAASGSASP